MAKKSDILLKLRKHDWVPAWRDPANYEFLEDATNQQWAWQFLRRNPSYQDDFEEATNTIKDDKHKFDEPAMKELTTRLPITSIAESNPFSPFELLLQLLLPLLVQEKERFSWVPSIFCRFPEKYNLKKMADPAKPDLQDIFIVDDPSVPTVAIGNYVLNPRKIAKTNSIKITFTFDKSGSLLDQLAYAQSVIKELVPCTGKKRKSFYCNCLRYLDAQADKAPRHSLLKQLKITSSSIDQLSEKARELLETGFFELSRSKKVQEKGKMAKRGEIDGKMLSMLPPEPPPYVNVIASGDTEVYVKH